MRARIGRCPPAAAAGGVGGRTESFGPDRVRVAPRGSRDRDRVQRAEDPRGLQAAPSGGVRDGRGPEHTHPWVVDEGSGSEAGLGLRGVVRDLPTRPQALVFHGEVEFSTGRCLPCTPVVDNFDGLAEIAGRRVGRVVRRLRGLSPAAVRCRSQLRPRASRGAAEARRCCRAPDESIAMGASGEARRDAGRIEVRRIRRTEPRRLEAIGERGMQRAARDPRHGGPREGRPDQAASTAARVRIKASRVPPGTKPFLR